MLKIIFWPVLNEILRAGSRIEKSIEVEAEGDALRWFCECTTEDILEDTSNR